MAVDGAAVAQVREPTRLRRPAKMGESHTQIHRFNSGFGFGHTCGMGFKKMLHAALLDQAQGLCVGGGGCRPQHLQADGIVAGPPLRQGRPKLIRRKELCPELASG